VTPEPPRRNRPSGGRAPQRSGTGRGGRPSPRTSGSGGTTRRVAEQRRSTSAGARRTPPRATTANRRRPRRRALRLGSSRRRITVGFAAVATVVLILGGRLVQLQGLDGTGLAVAAEQRRTMTTDLEAERGRILDANGGVLAYSVDARAVYADPSLVSSPLLTAQALAPLLKQSVVDLQDKLSHKGRFVYLARSLTPQTATRVMNLALPGVNVLPESQRLHPAHDVAANVVGFTDRDGHGMAGIESSLDSKLAGKPGRLTVMKGAGGEVIPSGVHKDDPAVPGSSVQLTISQDLQYVAQKALDQAVHSTGAKDGQITILDAKTGAIKAMASAPTYDAADPGRTPQSLSNPNISSVFEPGSANKVVTFAAALQRGLITPKTAMTVPGTIQFADRTIHDDWVHDPVGWTTTGILAKSSNVGTLMIAKKLGPAVWDSYAKKFGEGQPTGVALPAESAGILPPMKDWSGSTFGNLPIGQGVAVTSLQLADMYQAIANNGVRVPPHVVEKMIGPTGAVTKSVPGKPVRVVSAKTAATLREMLQMVTQDGGTAPKAAINGYTTAGKTGTGQKPNPACNCYEGGGYWSTFAGMAPADHPRYVMSIMVDSPQTDYLGGDVAAPLFHEVMSYALKQGDVAPTGAAPAHLPLFAP
jgi:cell division protein FtsI (penicillin-binding protein 3)